MGEGSGTTLIIYMALFFVVIYFLVMRPNNKQQSERRTMLNSVRVNDRIVSVGGIHGKVTKIDEDKETFKLQVAPNMEVEFSKSAVQSIENRDWKDEHPQLQKRGLFRRGK